VTERRRQRLPEPVVKVGPWGRCDKCGQECCLNTLWAEDPDVVAEVCCDCKPGYLADGFHPPGW
jgi:hypothetical protein